MHEYTTHYLKKALFDTAIGEFHAAPEWTDYDLPWEDPQNLSKTRPLYKSDGLHFYNHENKLIEGRLWGGCLETLDLHLSIRRYLPTLEQLKGCILYLETSEEMPSEGCVYRFIAALGELGILDKIKGILFGRPKAQFCGHMPSGGREAFIASQKEAVKSALNHYGSTIPVIFNLTFGHTDPQVIIPNGGIISINGTTKTICFG